MATEGLISDTARDVIAIGGFTLAIAQTILAIRSLRGDWSFLRRAVTPKFPREMRRRDLAFRRFSSWPAEFKIAAGELAFLALCLGAGYVVAKLDPGADDLFLKAVGLIVAVLLMVAETGLLIMGAVLLEWCRANRSETARRIVIGVWASWVAVTLSSVAGIVWLRSEQVESYGRNLVGMGSGMFLVFSVAGVGMFAVSLINDSRR